QLEEVVEVGLREGRFLADFQIRQIVIPDRFGLAAPREKNQVRLDAGAGGREHAARKAEDAPNVAFLQQLALGLHERGFVGAEQDAFVKNDAACASAGEAFEYVLEEEDLGGARLVLEVRLGSCSLFAAEWRIHQDVIEKLWSATEQLLVHADVRKSVAV